MPLITQKRREAIKNQPGDLCYIYYKDMVEEWKKNPQWTTAHNIYERMIRRLAGVSWDGENPELIPKIKDDIYQRKAAYQLAWQVFFQFYVIPYELKKREENGDFRENLFL
jgi:hypothetical protein